MSKTTRRLPRKKPKGWIPEILRKGGEHRVINRALRNRDKHELRKEVNRYYE